MNSRPLKAFVFSIDYLIALMLFVSIVYAVHYLSASTSAPISNSLLMKKQAQDILAVLHKTHSLDSLNQNTLNSSLSSLIGDRLNWMLNVEYYNYSGGFELVGNFSVSNTATVSNNTVTAHRTFVVYQEGNPRYYGLAKLILWQ